MVTRFDDFVRRKAVTEENLQLRSRLLQLGAPPPPLPEGISPDEENFFLKRFVTDADPALAAERRRRFAAILTEPIAAPAATTFAKLGALAGDVQGANPLVDLFGKLFPQEFQQAVAEERLARAPGPIPLGGPERGAFERTRQEFAQIPVPRHPVTMALEKATGLRAPGLRHVGVAELGEAVVDPLNLLFAAKPIVGAVRGAPSAIRRGAQEVAEAAAQRVVRDPRAVIQPAERLGARAAGREVAEAAARPLTAAGVGEAEVRALRVVDVPEGLPGRPQPAVVQRGAEGLPPRVSDVVPLRGKVLVPTDDPVLLRVTEAIRETKPLTEDAQRLIAQGRKRQIARAGAAARGAATPLEVGPAFERALAGELGKVGFEPIRPLFTMDEIQRLVGRYIWSDESRLARIGQLPGQVTFDQFNAWKGFQKLFHPEATVIPTPSEFGLLERAFGKEFISAVMSKRGAGQKAWNTFLDVWNMPRALLATADLSATVRQGGVLAAGDPKLAQRAFQFQLRAFGSESFTQAADDIMRTDPLFSRFTRRPGQTGRAGERLSITEIGVSAPLSRREEQFLTGMAGKIPVIRNSERAFVTNLNTLRFYRMKRMVQQLEGAGVEVTEAQLDAIATFINWASGRGPLGKAEAAAPLLNGLFFSIRLATSRFALPAALLTRAPGVRAQIAKNMVAYVALGLGIIELANAAGADVTLNPMSSDFAKIRIGNTRLDVWGGFLPPIRLITQLLTGKRKSASTGTISDVNPGETIGRFLRSKAHPSLGLGIDVSSEEDYLGEDFSLDPKNFLTPNIRRNPLLRTITPLIIQDVAEALKEDGIAAATIAGASGLVGVGVTSFVTADQTSKETYGVPYVELWPFEKGYIRLLTRQASDREASEFDKADDQHYADFLTLAESTELSTRDKVDQYFSINTFYAGLRRGLGDAIFGDGEIQIIQGGTPEQQAALQEYYDGLDSMKPSPESAVFFRERWSALISQLEAKWRREGTLDYVQANTNTRQIPQDLFDILPTSTKARIKASSDARVRQDQRRGRTEPKVLPRQTVREEAEVIREQFAPTPVPTNGARPAPAPRIQTGLENLRGALPALSR